MHETLEAASEWIRTQWFIKEILAVVQYCIEHQYIDMKPESDFDFEHAWAVYSNEGTEHLYPSDLDIITQRLAQAFLAHPELITQFNTNYDQIMRPRK